MPGVMFNLQYFNLSQMLAYSLYCRLILRLLKDFLLLFIVELAVESSLNDKLIPAHIRGQQGTPTVNGAQAV